MEFGIATKTTTALGNETDLSWKEDFTDINPTQTPMMNRRYLRQFPSFLYDQQSPSMASIS